MYKQLLFTFCVASVFFLAGCKTSLLTGNPETPAEQSIFQIDDRGVVYIGGSMGEVVLVEADLATFVGVGGIYGKDAQRVFSCQVDCQAVTGADADTFTVMEVGVYGQDQNHVYKDGVALTGVDTGSFKILNQNYYQDRAGVYLNGSAVMGADTTSFRVLDDLWAVDAQQVYYQGKLISGADPKTMTILPNMYAKDSQYVYFDGKVIPSADTATFSVIEGTRAQDKNRYYENGVVTKSTKDAITDAFSKKYKRPTNEIIIDVEVDTGLFAKGSVQFKDEFGGGIWFGAKTSQGWVLAHDGQGPMSCDLATKYQFPTDLVPGCVDVTNDNAFIQR